jgi:hypothetical protein
MEGIQIVKWLPRGHEGHPHSEVASPGDKEGIQTVTWLPQGTTINSVTYCGILTSSSENTGTATNSLTMTSRGVSTSQCGPEDWFAAAIRKLPEIWQQCIDLSGDSIWSVLKCAVYVAVTISQPIIQVRPNHF